MSILTSHMMVTKNPQNVHRKCFWTILVIFIFDIKIDVNMCEPHYVNLLFFVNLLYSLCVWLFDIWHLFWHFDIFLTFWNFFKLKPPQPITGLFFIGGMWVLDRESKILHLFSGHLVEYCFIVDSLLWFDNCVMCLPSKLSLSNLVTSVALIEWFV